MREWEIEQLQKWQFFLKFIIKNQPDSSISLWYVISCWCCYFHQIEKKQFKFWKEKHEKTISCFEISHIKEAEVRDTFQ